MSLTGRIRGGLDNMDSTENMESKPDRSLLFFSVLRGWGPWMFLLLGMPRRTDGAGARSGPLSRSAGRGPGTGRVQGRASAERALVWEPDLERGAGGGRRGRRGGPRWPRTLLLVSGRRPPPPALAAPSPRPAPATAPGRSPGTRSPGTRCPAPALGPG